MRLRLRYQSALAAFLAACVLLLGLAAVSPELHELICVQESHAHLHAGNHESFAKLAADSGHRGDTDCSAPADDDHDCAVHLFAHGCTVAVPVLFVSPPVLNATRVAHFTEFMLSRTLRGPERACGPPSQA